MRRLLTVITTMLVIAACQQAPAERLPPPRAECAPRDTRVVAPYPISGYWVTPDPDACRTRRTVEAMHRLGADTVIVSGPRLVPGAHAQAGPEVERVFTYDAQEEFGPALTSCPGRDRVEDGARLLFVPVEGTCESGRYDLIVVRSLGDGVGHLAREAAAFGMKLYSGLPAAPQDTAKPWLPDLSALRPLSVLTELILKDYQARYGTPPGLYQTFELALRERHDNDPIIDLYRAQHRVVAQTMPGATLLLSPYLDARRGRGYAPKLVAQGMRDLASTRSGLPMVIAAQDSRGTGKVGVFTPDEAAAALDPNLEPIVGPGTNEQAYHGSTRDYFLAASRTRLDGVELWMNLEVFEPSPQSGACTRPVQPQRGRTVKDRVDRQLSAAAGLVAKVVSYAWDPYLTCAEDSRQPLGEEIAARWSEPIVYSAARSGDGLALRGHRLDGARITISYRAAGGPFTTVEAVGAAWVPFAPADVDPRWPWIRVSAGNATFSLRWDERL
ncbi:DUF4434 domain-containing protein [Nonomuraea soli]|uniref:DUF4434 domain-containing protein n=1 Tax=Nonomuraea soli TaxID=1032476 RepID=A0A7W0CGW8_9ACTN|nr:DUF4434 domain-containing protein [Nonomuraea soli]MBA2890946.1 hypothetical protein [Nonomuraea soli]